MGKRAKLKENEPTYVIYSMNHKTQKLKGN